jgi:hypothetical protein
MIYVIYPEKDATIYERTESKNTGLDSILEVSHILIGTASRYNSRVLMKFDTSQIEEQVSAGKISENARYYLILKTAEVREIPQEYTLYAYPVSSSWTNGTGRFVNNPIVNDGVSWRYRTSANVGTEWDIPPTTASLEWDDTSETWIQDDGIWGNNTPTANVTSSYFSKEGGGTWWDYDNVECTQSFSFETQDVYMDITPIFRKWITGSGRFNNDGLILKFSNELESSFETINSLKLFATDSNTIYVPRIHVIWDDQLFLTGSLTEVGENSLNLNVKMKKFYSQDEKAKIRIYANERFPQRSYTTQSYHMINYHLPSSSYYEIRDAHTDEAILPFNSTGSKISCDENGNYFNVWMNAFQPERFYRVVIKVERDGGDVVEMFDNNYYFKVTR